MVQSVDVLIEGGKATAAPPLGPALGPLGVNIGKVVADINTKTASFKGMQVPVKVTVQDDKSYEITVGTPPASALIKQEAKIQKGSGKPQADHVADLRIENIIKIAKMKEDDLLGKSMKEKVKEIIGTCNSMGVMVEGKHAQDALRELEKGSFDKEIASGKTEISAEELKEMEAEKKQLQEEMQARHAEMDKKAQAVLKEMEGKDRSAIKHRLQEIGVPDDMIAKLLPTEAKVAPGKGAEKGAAPKAAPAKAPAKK
ncbi:MAG: 50S ribosomal protein L11 [Candidatus Woesearchaeota archaeon]